MVAFWITGYTPEEARNKSKGREPHLAQLIDFNRSWLCCSYCMKLKSLQMLWAITLPFKGAYDMLATFNEILFKMPSADSVRFHVELQLEERVEKVCSPPACLCNVWRPPQGQRELLISWRWFAGMSKCFCCDEESVFQFRKRLQRVHVCVCG